MPLFDIVLQFGDNFSSNGESSWGLELLNTILGAAIGSGATVYVLYRTIKQDKINEEGRRKQFQKEKLKYFQSLVGDITVSLPSQIEAFKSYANEIESQPLELPLMSYTILGELDIAVNRINQEDYYHSYLGVFGDTQNSINEFRDIMSTLNYFNGNLTLIEESLKKSFDYDHTRKISLRDLIDKIEEHAALIAMDQEIRRNYPSLHEFINKFMVDFTQRIKTNADLKSYHDNLFSPLKNYLLEFGLNVPLVHHMLTLLRDATIRYNDVIFQNLEVAKNFKGIHSDMEKGYIKLQEQSKRLLEYKEPINSISV